MFRCIPQNNFGQEGVLVDSLDWDGAGGVFSLVLESYLVGLMRTAGGCVGAEERNLQQRDFDCRRDVGEFRGFIGYQLMLFGMFVRISVA